MAIATAISIDVEIDRPNDLVLVHAVQGEYYSRQVTANLKQNGSVYTINDPTNVIPIIKYRRPDGYIGFYDFDPNENRIVNILSGNHQIRFTLSPEMCSVPGRVFAHIDLQSRTSAQRLSAFYFCVDVESANDPIAITKTNSMSVQDLLKDVLGEIYTPSSTPQEGAIIDNTLSIPGAVGDAKAMGDIVLIQESQPDLQEQPTNKLWIDSDSHEDGTEVPDMTEFNALASRVSSIERNALYLKGVLTDEDDLDALLEPGMWYVAGTVPNNWPISIASTTSGVIMVFGSRSETPSHKAQIVITPNGSNNSMYYRSGLESGWGSFKKVNDSVLTLSMMSGMNENDI